MGTPARAARSTPADARSTGPRLGVTRYDEAAAALITALILAGAVVVLLFLMWLTTRIWVRPPAVEPQLLEPLAGGGSALAGEPELAEPGDEVIDEVEPPLEEMLEAVTDVVSSQPVLRQSFEGNAESRSAGDGSGGPAGEGSANLVPRWLRWEVRFPESTIANYARQLDALGIELAAVGGGRTTIDYAAELRKNHPVRRSAREDSRIYFRWSRDDQLRQADLELLRRAGIATDGRLILKFIPPNLENKLAHLEDAAIRAKGWRLEDVRRTVFAVVPSPDGFQIRVVQVHSR